MSGLCPGAIWCHVGREVLRVERRMWVGGVCVAQSLDGFGPQFVLGAAVGGRPRVE